MADEIIIKAPQIEPNITINISGEDQLHSCTATLNSMLRGNKCYRYFKDRSELYTELNIKCRDYKVSIPREQARDILNIYNAYIACQQEQPSEIPMHVCKTIESIKSHFGETLFPYTVSEFKSSFSTLERLRAYGLNLEEFLALYESIKEI